jgi:hypothetical protein
VPSQLKVVVGVGIGGRVGKASEVAAGRVVIGMDPHKRSVTIEVMAGDDRGDGRRRSR